MLTVTTGNARWLFALSAVLSPPGNKGVMPFGIGRKPFRKGVPCADCQSGHGWCDDGLCVDCPNGDCPCPLKVILFAEPNHLHNHLVPQLRTA